MGKILYKVTLTNEERNQLISMTKKGNLSSRKIVHGLILLNADEGDFSDRNKLNNRESCEFLKVGKRMVERIKRLFVETGMESALEDKPIERKHHRKADGEVEARLIAICCREASARIRPMVITSAC